jgi:putative aminopeptidase FrvX
MVKEITIKWWVTLKEFNMKEKLKELLSIPTKTWEEERLINYLMSHFEEMGYDYEKDDLGNLYVTKGVSDYYPLVLAHTDSVHDIVEMEVREEYLPNSQGESKLALKAYTKEDGAPTGIGGDDKAGVFICLQLLEKFDVIKAFFPVAEETGCHGSRGAKEEFFKDVGYAIQFDSTENDTMSLSLMGVRLFEQKSEFFNKTRNIILEHGFTEWRHHPYTDTMVLKDKFNFACLNFAAGYYNYHTSNEYVIIDDVKNSIKLGENVISKLGNSFYEFKSKQKESDFWFD